MLFIASRIDGARLLCMDFDLQVSFGLRITSGEAAMGNSKKMTAGIQMSGLARWCMVDWQANIPSNFV